MIKFNKLKSLLYLILGLILGPVILIVGSAIGVCIFSPILNYFGLVWLIVLLPSLLIFYILTRFFYKDNPAIVIGLYIGGITILMTFLPRYIRDLCRHHGDIFYNGLQDSSRYSIQNKFISGK